MKKLLQNRLVIALIAILAFAMVFANVACGGNKETEYKISFVSEGVTLYETTVKEGELPVYVGTEPTKESTADKVYKFEGWSPELTEAVENTVYTAVFGEEVRKYSVKIGEAAAVEVAFGSLLTKPADPVKDTTASTVYEFIGWYNGDKEWDFEKDAVTGDLVLTAKFNEQTRKYSVKIGEAAAIEVAYGSLLTKPEDPEKENSDSTIYEFIGWYNGDKEWNFEKDTVTGDLVLTAKFNEQTRKYSVKIGEAAAIEVEYGSILTKPEDPEKENSDSTIYEFIGWYNGDKEWDFEKDTVTGDLVLTARFIEQNRKYSVKIGEAAAIEVAFGSLLTKPADPVKDMTVATIYEFAGWYNGDKEWDFEKDTVTGDLVLTARFNEYVRKYKVVIDGVENEYAFGSKIDRPAAKEGCLVIAKNGDTEWKFDSDVVREDMTITTEQRLISASGSELYAFKEWNSEDTAAIAAANGMESGNVHLSPENFDNDGIRIAAEANKDVTVVFPKINYNAYGKVEFKFICNWGTRCFYIGDKVEEGDANKLGSYDQSNSNTDGSWNNYWTIVIEGTSIKKLRKDGTEDSTWIGGALAAPVISEKVANGEEALKLTIKGGGMNLELSDIFCHLAKDTDEISVHTWTEDEVKNAEGTRYTNVTYSYVKSGNTPTSKWAFDWQGRLKASGTGYADINIPAVNFNNYSEVYFYVYCNWGSRTIKTGDSAWRDQYTLGTVENTGDTYAQYGIVTIKDGKLYYRLNTEEADTEVRTLTSEILNGTDNIVLSFKESGGNNIVISDMLCTTSDYIKGLK